MLWVANGLQITTVVYVTDPVSVIKTPKFNFKSPEPSLNLEATKLKPLELVTEKSKYKIKLTKSDKELLRKLDMEHRAKLTKQSEENHAPPKAKAEQNMEKESKQKEDKTKVGNQQPKVATKPNPKSKQKVNILELNLN